MSKEGTIIVTEYFLNIFIKVVLEDLKIFVKRVISISLHFLGF